MVTTNGFLTSSSFKRSAFPASYSKSTKIIVLSKTNKRITYFAFVRVGVLGVNASVVLDVLEGVVHQAAVATVVTVLGRTIDEVLLAERHELARLAKVLSLQSSGLQKAEHVNNDTSINIADVNEQQRSDVVGGTYGTE